jgi:hypothetical protein
MPDDRTTLGRCENKHVNLVPVGKLEGLCEKCGKPLIEWIKKG